MAPVDATWLRMEDPTNLMMVTALMMVAEPFDHSAFHRLLEQRLLAIPRFKQRVTRSAGGLGPLYWESDPNFRLENHLTRYRLRSKDPRAELNSLVDSLLSTPLEMSRPLWHLHVVEGHPEGVAIVSRIHHAVADGISLVQILLSLTDGGDHPDPGRASDVASESALANPFGFALSQARRAARIAARVGGDPASALRFARFAVQAAETIGYLVTLPNDTPTVLKGSLGVAKRAAWSRPIPLSEVKAAGRHFGLTVNDLLIGTVTGALRAYVIGRGGSVVGLNVRAAVPVNLKPQTRGARTGNYFGLVYADLPLFISNRRRRLEEVKRRMDEIKNSAQAPIALGILAAMAAVPGAIQDLGVEFFAAKATLVLTNVPGPVRQLSLAGSAITQMMFWVPQSGRLALGISLISYAGTVRIGVASDAGVVPDPEKVVREFEREFEAIAQHHRRSIRTPG